MIVFTLIFGRFFCGWFCAFGTFNDLIYLISKKLFKVKIRMNSKVDNMLKYAKYVVLGLVVLIIWPYSNSFDKYNPWSAFAQIINIPNGAGDYAIGFVVLAVIMLGAVFIERFFCRYLCPLGAVLSLTSKVRGFRIYKPSNSCGKCGICTNNCPMGLELYKTEEVKSGECINCLSCVNSCPRKNSQLTAYGEKVNPSLAGGMVLILFTGFYGIINTLGGILNLQSKETMPLSSSISTSNSTENQDSGNEEMKRIYKDGVYTGMGFGFRPGLTVEVTIKDDNIKSIEIISHNESRRYYERPFNIIPAEIVEAQSADVDAVSGATRTSHGIMDAVEDALAKARI
jgi:polyferredoxin